MADFVLAPVPLTGGLGTGFWVQLQQDMLVAIQVLKDNTLADAGSGGSDEDAFDPDENTVTELMTGIASIITNKY